MRPFLKIVALSAAVAAWAAVEPAWAGLIARYNFDDSTATDQSPDGNNGVVGSNLFFTSDTPLGGGLAAGSPSNPGGGDPTRVIRVPTSASLESIDDQLSVSFWMKANTASNNNWVRIFQHGTEGNPSRTWLIDRYSDTADVNVRVDTNAGPGGVFNQNIAVGGIPTFDGDWHHVLYTLDSGRYWEYVDGRLSTSGTYAHGDGLYNTLPLYIFGRNNDGEYVGLLDDIAVWSDAKGSAWPATIAALADWYGTSLDDPGVGEVASLDTLGDEASAGGSLWMYVNDFPAAMDGNPLFAGRHYFGVDSAPYIIFQSDGQGGWLGVQRVPEPASLWLLAPGGAAALWLLRRRLRRRAGSGARAALGESRKVVQGLAWRS